MLRNLSMICDDRTVRWSGRLLVVAAVTAITGVPGLLSVPSAVAQEPGVEFYIKRGVRSGGLSNT